MFKYATVLDIRKIFPSGGLHRSVFLCFFILWSGWTYLVNDCSQVLCAWQWLEELDAEQGGHRVGKHVLDGTGWCSDPKDECQWKAVNVLTVEQSLFSRDLPSLQIQNALAIICVLCAAVKNKKAIQLKSLHLPADEDEVLKNSWVKSLQIFENDYNRRLPLLISDLGATFFPWSISGRFLKNTKTK